MTDTPRNASHARTPRLFLGFALAALIAPLAGCQGAKAVNTTALSENLTAGERNVQPLVVPGNLVGTPGTTLVLPSVPGKNVKFAKYYPDGTPELTLETSRSAVLDVLLSGVSQIDAAKFAEDAAQREWVTTLLDRAITIAQPFLARLATPPAPGTPGAGAPTDTAQTIRKSIRAEIQALIADPATLPTIRAWLGLPPASSGAGAGTAPSASVPTSGLGTVIEP